MWRVAATNTAMPTMRSKRRGIDRRKPASCADLRAIRTAEVYHPCGFYFRDASAYEPGDLPTDVRTLSAVIMRATLRR